MVQGLWIRKKGDYHGLLPSIRKDEGIFDRALSIKDLLTNRGHPYFNLNRNNIDATYLWTLHQSSNLNHHPFSRPPNPGTYFSKSHRLPERFPIRRPSMQGIRRSHLDQDELVMWLSPILGETNLVDDKAQWAPSSVLGPMIRMPNLGWLLTRLLLSVIWV